MAGIHTEVGQDNNGTGLTGDMIWASDAPDVAGDDLRTAISTMLFSDALADPDRNLPGDQRGWWGDVLGTASLGSQIWTYARAKKTVATLVGVEATINTALSPLVDQGIVATIDVSANWLNLTRLQVRVVCTKPDGTTIQYAQVWPF